MAQALEKMFDQTSARYDLLNSFMSLGQDGAWRRTLSAELPEGARVLDVCCGSARSAVTDFDRTRTPVIGVDFSQNMLAVGRRHARELRAAFLPVRGDAFSLPFRGESFDAVTIAWGLRNLRPESQALDELARILRPEGWLHVLDSPSPSPGWLGHAHRAYLRHVVPVVGRLSDDPDAYRYLADSVLAFGTHADVAARLRRAGYRDVTAHPLMWGAAAVWRGRRPAPAVRVRKVAPTPLQETISPGPSVHPATSSTPDGAA